MITHRIRPLGRAGAALCVTAMLSACAESANTPGYGPRPVAQTAVQKAIAKCAFSVGAGAILGGIVGGDKNDVVAGALLGGAACAVFLEVASREDRARLAAAEKAALEANRSTTRSFTTSKGKKATVRTTVKAAPTPKAPATKDPKPVAPTKPKARTTPAAAVQSQADPVYTACRYATQSVTVDGKAGEAPQQLWCRVDTGDWQAVAE